MQAFQTTTLASDASFWRATESRLVAEIQPAYEQRERRSRLKARSEVSRPSGPFNSVELRSDHSDKQNDYALHFPKLTATDGSDDAERLSWLTNIHNRPTQSPRYIFTVYEPHLSITLQIRCRVTPSVLSFRRDRVCGRRKHGSGVCIYAKTGNDCFVMSPYPTADINIEILWLHSCFGGNEYIFAPCYHPRGSTIWC